jgi:hypothetical protein
MNVQDTLCSVIESVMWYVLILWSWQRRIFTRMYTAHTHIYRVSQEERSIFWEVIVSVILSKKLYRTCVLFRTVSEIEPFDCIVVWLGCPVLSFPPALLRHCLKHVNLCEASVGCCDCWWWHCRVLQKMPHIFTNAKYADMLYFYGFCNGSATVAVEEYRRRFPMHRIPDCWVFSKVFNTLRECGTLPCSIWTGM